MTLQFKIRGQTLYKLTPGDAVEGTRNYINCQFDFQTEDWEGCIKTALFQPPGGVEPYPVMLVDGTCTVPWEALEHPGLVSVSVFGVKDDYKITSSVVQIRNRATLTGGAATEPPTPTVYEQVLNDLAGTRQHATEQAQESKAAADEAKGYAESAANTVDGFSAVAETASKAITAEGALQVSNIKSAGQTAIQSVTAEGERQVAAVGAAGTEALQAVQDAAAEIVTDREQISTNKDNIASLRSKMRTKADAIVRTVSGENLLVKDSSDDAVRGLKVFGRTTQDGTPTPDAPVPLVSVGDAGSVDVWAYGKNLVDVRELKLNENTSLHVSDDGYTITVIGGSKNRYASSRMELDAEFFRGKTIHIKADSVTTSVEHPASLVQVRCVKSDGSEKYFGLTSAQSLYRNIEFAHDIAKIYIQVHSNNTNTLLDSDNTVVVKGLRVTLEPDAEWEPYKESQSLAIQTPNGLPGIPVTDTSLATYTDADGQMWCSDEVDFERGVYVQRVLLDKLDSSHNWRYSTSTGRFYYKDDRFICAKANIDYHPNAFCSHFSKCGHVPSTGFNDLEFGFINHVDHGFAFRYDALNGDIDAWKTFLNEKDVYVLGVLVSPIETPLTESELTAYQSLQSNYPVTTVLNDAGAGMELKYNADTQLYIDNKITEVLASLANTNAQLL